MPGHWFGLIELLLVFGLVLGWAGWQWWDWWRWRKTQERKRLEQRDLDE
ncbi:hypothetical protein [Roseateles sp. LYH14W]|uniref:LapA family protein n=1 Tax=Pelomonas parva TaxID=3299032 RepID=A0ABW7F9X7_9BURK